MTFLKKLLLLLLLFLFNLIFFWSISSARVEGNSDIYLINLWWPSICQRARGEWTLYRLLLTATLQRCITPMGSVLKRDCLILSFCTRCPLLCSNPFTILIPIFGWDCCADVTKSSSSPSLIWLNIPKRTKYSNELISKLDTVLYRKITSWASCFRGCSKVLQCRYRTLNCQPKLNPIFDFLFCFVTSSHI